MTNASVGSQHGSVGLRKPITLVGRTMPVNVSPHAKSAPAASSVARLAVLAPSGP